MRLLNVYTIEFQEFNPESIPKYAIASHRWTDNEASIKDIRKRRNLASSGYKKIEGYAEFVRTTFPDIQWLWIDTCCIKQHSTMELTEAVNSMFRWYLGAEICIAYLVDVQHANDERMFLGSAWFTRGWTLQELLASRLVVFVTQDWKVIGHKGSAVNHERAEWPHLGPSIDKIISLRTGIPEDLLHDFKHMQGYGVDEVLIWMGGRVTLREEDMSYSLFGLLDVNTWLNYGEGGDKARKRLLAEVAGKDLDSSSDTMSTWSGPNVPVATHTLPFRRDPDFIDRPELRTLQQKLSISAARVALLGLGGVGKSQLVIEYCYRVRDRSPGTWVLWVHASTASRFEQSMREIADRVKIPGRDDPTSNIFKLVFDWLSDSSNGPWLLVLDNADEAGYLFGQTQSNENTADIDQIGTDAKPIVEYIPISAHGAMVVTTRSREMALRLVDHDESSIIITMPMQMEQALSMLQSKVREIADNSGRELVAALDHMPLAISQAAAYIQRRRPRCSVQDYLKTMEKSDKSRQRLLNANLPEPRRDHREATNSITLAWQISFDHIYQVRRSAVELLALMSFFNHQGIPITLLQSKTVEDDGDGGGADDESSGSMEEAFEEDVTILCNYLFISISADGSTFEMHRLVQLATRTWLEIRGEHRKWLEQSVKHLHGALPETNYSDWPQWRVLYPHIKMALAAGSSSHAERNDMKLQLAYIFNSTAVFALSQGYFTDAEALATQAVNTRLAMLGEEDPDTMMAMANLAKTYFDQGRFKEAEEIQIRVLALRTRVLGEWHPRTLLAMNNLAMTYYDQGDAAKAEELQTQVLELHRQLNGEDHPSTLLSMNNLAMTYFHQDRLIEAEQIQVRVLELYTSVLGERHPSTLTCMTNLGRTYFTQSKLLEAERLQTRVLRLQTDVIGNDHPDAIANICNLATTYSSQGRFREAQLLEAGLRY